MIKIEFKFKGLKEIHIEYGTKQTFLQDKNTLMFLLDKGEELLLYIDDLSYLKTGEVENE